MLRRLSTLLYYNKMLTVALLNKICHVAAFCTRKYRGIALNQRNVAWQDETQFDNVMFCKVRVVRSLGYGFVIKLTELTEHVE